MPEPMNADELHEHLATDHGTNLYGPEYVVAQVHRLRHGGPSFVSDGHSHTWDERGTPTTTVSEPDA